MLVIAVDGTNMSKVLQDDETPNTNFINLMNTSTTSAPSIVGHTTISNPSWTADPDRRLGQQDGRDQQRLHPVDVRQVADGLHPTRNGQPANIRTKAIADWDVIAAIADSGVGADEVVYIPQVSPATPTGRRPMTWSRSRP